MDLATGGSTAPGGRLGIELIHADGSREIPSVGTPAPAGVLSWRDLLTFGLPRRDLDPVVNDWRTRNFPRLAKPWAKYQLARRLGFAFLFGKLSIAVIRADGSIEDYGLASLRLVTNNGAGFIVDAFQNLVELENMKFHGLGTGTNAEAAGDSALQTELTTQYNPDNTRATGSLTEASAQVFRTVGTNTFDASAAVTEHGILTQAATGGGTLLDRSVFSAINVVSGDSIQTTYDLTINSGN